MASQVCSVIPTDAQLELVARPIAGSLFLEGPAGTGKTTAGILRMLRMLKEGVPGRLMLVIIPQRTLATPYYDALRRPTVDAGGQVTILTVGGIAQRMVDLFWPLIAAQAGFGEPARAPTFLTLETAQYFMARLVRPLLDQGYFETAVIDRNRIYSQIIDGLNKSASVGFPHSEIGERLRAAWSGEPSQVRLYDEAQACATQFRKYCLEHNLLDFSLQMEVFVQHLWPLDLCRDYLLQTYRYLIVDNVEEDTRAAHDVLGKWLQECDSALVISDLDGGFRRFLGADPSGAAALAKVCDERVRFPEPVVSSPAVRSLEQAVSAFLAPSQKSDDAGFVARSRQRQRAANSPSASFRSALKYQAHRFHPETLDWVASEIDTLVHEQHVAPDQIVVLAPFLTDRLRFSLSSRLSQRGVPARSHRPSRALREEPSARCLLTLTAIAHPTWSARPSRYDVRAALMTAIDGLDLVRAQLLADVAYRPAGEGTDLGSFDEMAPDMQERITYVLGQRYERLRHWVLDYAKSTPGRMKDERPDSPEAGIQEVPLDHFLGRLFVEVLSQPGFGFHHDYDAARTAATLIESVRKFRWVTSGASGGPASASSSPGQEYLEMVEDGVIAAQYVSSWRDQPTDAVLLAPAYTFLMENRPVDHQFWLDVGSLGWWERIYQPLTHAYVLSRRWPRGRKWTDSDEVETRQRALYRLTLGLVRRCRERIYLALSELDEQGVEQRGPLLQAIQRALREDARLTASKERIA